MADETTLDEVIGLIGILTNKLESISGQLDRINGFERLDALEARMVLVEKAIIGLDDLRARMTKVEEAVSKNTEGLAKNTAGLAQNTQTLNDMNK
jgi:hypothetical protein